MSKPDANPEARLALFQEREIRRTLHNDEWWFVITDIVAALTDAANPSDYWKKMRKRDPDLGKALEGGGQLVPPLALAICDGWRASETSVLEYRGHLPPDPVHTLAQGGAAQERRQGRRRGGRQDAQRYRAADGQTGDLDEKLQAVGKRGTEEAEEE